MVEIVAGELVRNEVTKNAMGGSELMAIAMQKNIPQELLKKFQIIHSRTRELREDLKKILVCHDLAQDPEVQHLKDGGWKKYDKLVFVSQWQFQQYHNFLGVPYSHSRILKNAIEPIPNHTKPSTDTIRIIYHTTPHRGLNLLYYAFDALAKQHDNIELDVYSSFKIYGWEQRDEPYKELFKQLEEHPKIRYHGTVSNEEVRKALTQAHIFAYPSVWQETSCIALIEAMSAGCMCVHPNFAALPETAANWTSMYQWDEDMNVHVNRFYAQLNAVITNLKNGAPIETYQNQKMYIDAFYNWERRSQEWQQFLSSFA
jgi:glycosyltransferase involved in cell wall biosynthesis